MWVCVEEKVHDETADEDFIEDDDAFVDVRHGEDGEMDFVVGVAGGVAHVDAVSSHEGEEVLLREHSGLGRACGAAGVAESEALLGIYLELVVTNHLLP